MKGLFAGLALLVVLATLSMNANGNDTEMISVIQRQNISMFDAVDPSVIQDTISEIQQKENGVYPIDTVYFNRTQGGSYEGRFLFLDTSNYAGVQYDVNVNSEGKLLGPIIKSIPSQFQNPYSGFSKKFPIGNLNSVYPKPDMQKVWDNYTVKV